MGKAAQGCFKTANNDRHVAVCFTYSVTVNNGCAVRTVAHLTTGTVIIVISSSFSNGIMRHHGIDIACSYKEAKSRTSKFLERLCAFVVGLWENGNSKALSFKHS